MSSIICLPLMSSILCKKQKGNLSTVRIQLKEDSRDSQWIMRGYPVLGIQFGNNGWKRKIDQTSLSCKCLKFQEKMVGESRFELPTSCSQGRRANQAALLPDLYRLTRRLSVLRQNLQPAWSLFDSLQTRAGRADLNCRSGRLTSSAACQESLLIRRDGTLLLPRQAR
jgi:hypothetical protein